MNTVQTRNQARKQTEKMNNQPSYKDVTDSNEEKGEETDDESSKREKK